MKTKFDNTENEALSIARVSGCFFTLEINKTNTELISKNSKSCYIMGIGKTDYTIHRDANEIKDYYSPKQNFFENWSINLMHNYHVFQSRIKSICGQIKFRETFKYKGEIINVKRISIGIPSYCELVYNEGGRKEIDSITSEGQDYKLSNERLMYIVEVL
jgi:hypothetical protein